VRIRPATAQDAAAIASIYAPYVLATAVSFETAAPDEAEMARRIAANGDLYPWFVAGEADAPVLGYSSACQFRARHAYRFTVETSVYLADGARGRGIGTVLTRVLLELLENQGFTQAVAAITLPNPASVKMHEALGFVPAGAYEKVGFKFGEWHSVGLWQRGLAALSDQPEEPRPFSTVWKP
jgi:L-amino acid N-acyltransferase YncA